MLSFFRPNTHDSTILAACMGARHGTGWGQRYIGDLYPLAGPSASTHARSCMCQAGLPPDHTAGRELLLAHPLPRDRETLGGRNFLDLNSHHFFLFLKPEAARGNPASRIDPSSAVHGGKRKKQHETSGPGGTGPPGARVHSYRPPGPSAVVLSPSSLLVPPARFSVGGTHPLSQCVRK